MPLRPLRYWCFYKAPSYFVAPTYFGIPCLCPSLISYLLLTNAAAEYDAHYTQWKEAVKCSMNWHPKDMNEKSKLLGRVPFAMCWSCLLYTGLGYITNN